MKLSRMRQIDYWVGVPLCGLLSLFRKRRTSSVSSRSVRSILVILLSEMGSVVLAHPMLAHLKKRYPGASIYVLVFKGNREIVELLGMVPYTHILTLDDSSPFNFFRDIIVTLRKLRSLSLDVSIDCELFARVSTILSFLAGAQIRVGFHRYTQEGLYRGRLLTHPALYNPYIHISQQFVTLVHSIDSTTLPIGKRLVLPDAYHVPDMPSDPAAIHQMQERIGKDFPNLLERPLILLHPGGGALPIRAWPLDRYCELSKALLQRGASVGVIGLSQDRELAQHIRSHCDHDSHCCDLTGYTRSLGELIVLFRLSALIVTNDGGPGHFSSLTKTPTIILYGPETPKLYSSLNERAVHLYAGLSCSPCLTAYNHRNTPCDGDNVCLQSIPAEQVITKSVEMIAGLG